MAKSTTLNQGLRAFIAPKYWPTWIFIGIAYCLSFLPWKVQRTLGTYVGRLLYKLAPRRRRICDVNLEICYPNMPLDERNILSKRHFESIGQGLFETMTSWFRNSDHIAKRTQFNGDEVINEALAAGRGCLLVGAHFSPIDLCGIQLARHIEVHPIYKLQSNKVINWVMERQRQRAYKKTIERSNTREIIKSLKDNKIVWFAADQDYGRKNSVFAPFFKRECATISHVGRIAKMSKAPIVLYDYTRTESGYVLTLSHVKNVPSEDDVTNATRLNSLFEEIIEPKKEQYFWTHRRFKNQPNPEDPSPY
ncbi:lysophospholipid acyltransferase family protein [Marinomonas mediterranea]|jgi:Lauroyl/myristoyl acyltransferase|uniref:Lipid A biosynthesis acyltransferase n=1 Tax=Marinomonas mediterranea (strain ATCC 700492 / JCM 21426 / NBRC 103028 / MMB-1) TaxID=717774 RepID=F2JZV8_MARM1|nr:lysophospholipid acyltransferase family protein [Marinomonas mediterranea]ADZ92070.1 lipid A biosynthesis acyltransferase [Marinomonas mediterranea MMB-1]WCN10033.1 lipid A biosynthesis acyltransferase [Marinomonas mediterranea]WCN18139.1 lipid A biosynthesis acyltransferase [Marinomonas mediterranea MMB-1]